MARARGLLGLLTAASLAAFGATKPLKTTTSKTMTIEGPQGSDAGLLINVLRTDDLIADGIPSKPLLLEKISHLLIRVELTPTKCSVNGHSLPLTPSDSREMVKSGKVKEEVDPTTGEVKLKMMVEMKQVQTLKLPKDSPLVPLGLTSPELLKISDKYMAEGVVGAVLSVSEEPVEVEASTMQGEKLEAQAYKVTIGIQIMEIDGVLLSTTDLPSIDLLELIVHPDPQDPAKVVAITTLAPDALSESAQAAPEPTSADLSAASLLGGLEAGLMSALDMFGSMMKKVSHKASEFGEEARKSHHKPCHHHKSGHHGHHGHGSDGSKSDSHHHKSEEHEAFPQTLAAVPEMTYEPKHHITPGCLFAMLWRSVKNGPTVFKLGIPALILLGLAFAITKFAALTRKRCQQKQAAKEEAKALLGEYQDMAEEKAEVIIVVPSSGFTPSA